MDIQTLITLIITGIGVVITKYFTEKSKYNKSLLELNVNQKLTNEILSKIDEKQNLELENISTQIASLETKISIMENDNKKFKEASLIPEQLESNCMTVLKNDKLLNHELKQACQRGITLATSYFKRLYFKEKFNKEYEIEMLINIFKQIQSDTNFDKIDIEK